MTPTPSDPNHSPPLSADKIMKSSERDEEEAQCRSCVRLLQQVLQSSSSRPAQLLQSLYESAATTTTRNNLPWRVTNYGMDVRIPAETYSSVDNKAVRRRWSRLHPPEQEELLEHPAQSTTAAAAANRLLYPREQQLATSAAATASNSNPSLLTHNNNNKTEWMSLRCQPCSSTGPEGGARAFVMGPTPLSIVVCTNRLHATSPQAAVQEMEEILTHELVHVYDVRKLQLDLRDCENLAYSEVRAAREAECRYSWYSRSCAKRTAMTATSNLFPHNMAYKCMQKVFDTAMRDTRPMNKLETANKNATADNNKKIFAHVSSR